MSTEQDSRLVYVKTRNRTELLTAEEIAVHKLTREEASLFSQYCLSNPSELVRRYKEDLNLAKEDLKKGVELDPKQRYFIQFRKLFSVKPFRPCLRMGRKLFSLSDLCPIRALDETALEKKAKEIAKEVLRRDIFENSDNFSQNNLIEAAMSVRKIPDAEKALEDYMHMSEVPDRLEASPTILFQAQIMCSDIFHKKHGISMTKCFVAETNCFMTLEDFEETQSLEYKKRKNAFERMMKEECGLKSTLINLFINSYKSIITEGVYNENSGLELLIWKMRLPFSESLYKFNRLEIRPLPFDRFIIGDTFSKDAAINKYKEDVENQESMMTINNTEKAKKYIAVSEIKGLLRRNQMAEYKRGPHCDDVDTRGSDPLEGIDGYCYDSKEKYVRYLTEIEQEDVSSDSCDEEDIKEKTRRKEARKYEKDKTSAAHKRKYSTRFSCESWKDWIETLSTEGSKVMTDIVKFEAIPISMDKLSMICHEHK